MKKENNKSSKIALRTKIRQFAHWYNKFLFTNSKTGAKKIALNLNAFLKKWNEMYPNENPPDILWAKSVLKKQKNQKNRSLSADSKKALKNIIYQRTSCRSWTKKTIPQIIIEELLRLGIEAPSSANRQSVRFKIIKNSADKAYLAKISKHDFLSKAPLLILLGVDCSSYGNHEYDRIIEDAAVCAQNIAIGAEIENLGCCFITPLEIDQEAAKQKLNIPPQLKMLFILALGFRKVIPNKPARMELDQFLIKNTKI